MLPYLLLFIWFLLEGGAIASAHEDGVKIESRPPPFSLNFLDGSRGFGDTSSAVSGASSHSANECFGYEYPHSSSYDADNPGPIGSGDVSGEHGDTPGEGGTDDDGQQFTEPANCHCSARVVRNLTGNSSCKTDQDRMFCFTRQVTRERTVYLCGEQRTFPVRTTYACSCTQAFIYTGDPSLAPFADYDENGNVTNGHFVCAGAASGHPHHEGNNPPSAAQLADPNSGESCPGYSITTFSVDCDGNQDNSCPDAQDSPLCTSDGIGGYNCDLPFFMDDLTQDQPDPEIQFFDPDDSHHNTNNKGNTGTGGINGKGDNNDNGPGGPNLGPGGEVSQSEYDQLSGNDCIGPLGCKCPLQHENGACADRDGDGNPDGSRNICPTCDTDDPEANTTQGEYDRLAGGDCFGPRRECKCQEVQLNGACGDDNNDGVPNGGDCEKADRRGLVRCQTGNPVSQGDYDMRRGGHCFSRTTACKCKFLETDPEAICADRDGDGIPNAGDDTPDGIDEEDEFNKCPGPALYHRGSGASGGGEVSGAAHSTQDFCVCPHPQFASEEPCVNSSSFRSDTNPRGIQSPGTTRWAVGYAVRDRVYTPFNSSAAVPNVVVTVNLGGAVSIRPNSCVAVPWGVNSGGVISTIHPVHAAALNRSWCTNVPFEVTPTGNITAEVPEFTAVSVVNPQEINNSVVVTINPNVNVTVGGSTFNAGDVRVTVNVSVNGGGGGGSPLNPDGTPCTQINPVTLLEEPCPNDVTLPLSPAASLALSALNDREEVGVIRSLINSAGAILFGTGFNPITGLPTGNVAPHCPDNVAHAVFGDLNLFSTLDGTPVSSSSSGSLHLTDFGLTVTVGGRAILSPRLTTQATLALAGGGGCQFFEDNLESLFRNLTGALLALYPFLLLLESIGVATTSNRSARFGIGAR